MPHVEQSDRWIGLNRAVVDREDVRPGESEDCLHAVGGSGLDDPDSARNLAVLTGHGPRLLVSRLCDPGG